MPHVRANLIVFFKNIIYLQNLKHQRFEKSFASQFRIFSLLGKNYLSKFKSLSTAFRPFFQKWCGTKNTTAFDALLNRVKQFLKT